MYFCFQGAPPHPLLAPAHSRAAGLGLYPIFWSYPKATASSYSPSLNLAPTAKWVHPENPVTMNSEVSLRRVRFFSYQGKIGLLLNRIFYFKIFNLPVYFFCLSSLLFKVLFIHHML